MKNSKNRVIVQVLVLSIDIINFTKVHNGY